MPVLDRSRSYSQVIGRPGVVFEQDGHNYRGDGTCVDESRLPVAAPEPPTPDPVKQQRQPRKHAVRADAILRQQYGESYEEYAPVVQTPVRDVLADYRDPQASDGSMIVPARSWVDGV